MANEGINKKVWLIKGFWKILIGIGIIGSCFFIYLFPGDDGGKAIIAYGLLYILSIPATIIIALGIGNIIGGLLHR